MGKSNDNSRKNKRDEMSSDESDYEEVDRKYGNRAMNKEEFSKFVKRIFSSKMEEEEKSNKKKKANKKSDKKDKKKEIKKRIKNIKRKNMKPTAMKKRIMKMMKNILMRMMRKK